MKNIAIAIIDYECGNLHSALKSIELAKDKSSVSGDVVITNDPDTILKSDRIVLPGVGAFSACNEKFNNIGGLREAIEEKVFKLSTPILGICVGLQLMADKSFEDGEHIGLGWIPGEVRVLSPNDKELKIPHIGWNNVLVKREKSFLSNISGADFYFVHSYCFQAKESENIIAETEYGIPFASILSNGNIIGTQFHPEKSQGIGVQFLQNFMEWRP